MINNDSLLIFTLYLLGITTPLAIVASLAALINHWQDRYEWCRKLSNWITSL